MAGQDSNTEETIKKNDNHCEIYVTPKNCALLVLSNFLLRSRLRKVSLEVARFEFMIGFLAFSGLINSGTRSNAGAST